MLNNYETVFIMTPVLSDEQAKETVSKYKQLLASNGAKLVHEESWGLKKLAYPIQKKSSGFCLMEKGRTRAHHAMEFALGKRISWLAS
jgi:small subunit ribosomal protein S6